MRNCLVLGSGRSGTSMVAGILANAGYFMGDQLYPADEGNPKGYFENEEINSINEELLAPFLPARPSGILGKLSYRSRILHGQRWLVPVPLETVIPVPASYILERIKLLTAREPFCFKDPRFCYTLSLWRPLVGDAAFVCVFRHPAVSAASILKECRRDPHLHNLSMDLRQALQVWEMMYRHVLEIHYAQGGEWIFVHYDQFFDGSALDKLERTLDTKLDRDFADPKLKRSMITTNIPWHIWSLYQRLSDLAGWRDVSS